MALSEHDTRTTLFIVALVLVLVGTGTAYWVETDGQTVEVRDVQFEATNGTMMSGELYIPPGVSTADPAPAILATHGYINYHETQSPFAIEYARRGFVVLSIDQTGHGGSDPPAFAHGFGGPPALEYLRSLSMVDTDNIGLEGHSMGGWASVVAAAVHPDGYESMVLAGSSTGSFGAPPGSPEFPRNLAVIYGEYEEFRYMWAVDKAQNVPDSAKLQNVFGTDSTIQEDETYGSIEDGTARRLYTPARTHAGLHLSPTATAGSIEWFQETLEGEDPLPPGNQTWYFKELGTLIAMFGGILFMFPLGSVLVERYDRASGFSRDLPDSVGLEGAGRIGTALVAFFLPIVTYYHLQGWGSSTFATSALLPQQITTGVAVWASFNAIVILLGFVAFHYMNEGSFAELRASYGLGTDDGLWTIGKAALVSIGIVGGLYLLLSITEYLTGQGFRFWVFGIRPLETFQFWIFLRYLIPFIVFFIALGILLHGELRPRDGYESVRREIATNWALVGGPFVLLLTVQYGTLFTTGYLMDNFLTAGVDLLTIVAFQFLVLLSIVPLVSTYFFRKTGRIWTGAFTNALFVTWVIVAGTATHHPIAIF
ncbi:alpha/beta hydrolase family protein [Halorhabdus amylolytica]|uniref:alpha/beta hydrolase family protein n=1 Tax=Halorhabdus amylolytica TaxID=2559573 RepID=UPI0010AB1B6F|nr:alpha/beta fold hydrolase [Halorhabdus amylolytica]